MRWNAAWDKAKKFVVTRGRYVRIMDNDKNHTVFRGNGWNGGTDLEGFGKADVVFFTFVY